MTQVVTTRRNDIDWLRIFATYLLFVFSVAKVFDSMPFYHIKNSELSNSLSYVTFFIYQWHLPLFFLLAGWSRKASLQVRPGMESFKERIFRLVIPFITGCILVCPLIKYVELLGGQSMGFYGYEHTGETIGKTFASFLPEFFTRLDTFSWAHLWFLVYLFVFTLVSWPFFTWLLKRKVMPLKMGGTFVYLPIVPLSLIQLTMSERWPDSKTLLYDWTNVLYFFLYFVLGFVISRYSAYERAIHNEYRRAGILGIGLFALLALSASELAMPSIRMIAAAGGWCLVVWLLGFARAHLEHATQGISYLRESSLPVYLLHPIPVVLLGFFLIGPVHAGITVKFFALLTLSVASTMAVYHVLIRRIPVLRWVFGMKPEQRPGESWRDQATNRG